MHVAFYFNADSPDLGAVYGQPLLKRCLKPVLLAGPEPLHLKLHYGDLHIWDLMAPERGKAIRTLVSPMPDVKGQKERIVPFGARASQMVTRYVRQSRYDPLAREELFLSRDGEALSESTMKMLFQRLRKSSGIQRLHPHLLRHTFATHFLLAGGDAFTLQNILGHTTLSR